MNTDSGSCLGDALDPNGLHPNNSLHKVEGCTALIVRLTMVLDDKVHPPQKGLNKTGLWSFYDERPKPVFIFYLAVPHPVGRTLRQLGQCFFDAIHGGVQLIFRRCIRNTDAIVVSKCRTRNRGNVSGRQQIFGKIISVLDRSRAV